MSSTQLFGGTTTYDIDLDNSSGSSKYRLLKFIRGKPEFKKVYSDSPMVNGKRLVAYRVSDVVEEIHITIEASSIDDLLYQKAVLDGYFMRAMDAQVARNAGGGQGLGYYWLADRPRNASTKTYKSEIIEGEVQLPQNFYDTNMLANIAGDEEDPVIIRLLRRFYVSASTLIILNGVSATNGAGNYVSIGASGATAVTGDLAAPLSVKVVGGTALTKRVLMALAYNGTPANFKHIYWAKDGTPDNNTLALTGNYTVTNKALTSNVATLDIVGTHKHVAGDRVTVTGVDATFNGTHTLTAVGASTISYPKTAADVASTPSSGTVTGEIDGDGTGNGMRLTAQATVTNKALTSNVATLTIGTHGWKVGNTAVVTGVDATFNGTYTLSAVGASTISYPKTAADVASTPSSGTVSIPANTEIRVLRWINTTNIADQLRRAQTYARLRSNTASRYSIRVRVGITDGTNDFFPPDNAATDNFATDSAQAVGTHSGNALAWVSTGELNLVAVQTNGAAVYGIVLEVYVTCSDVSGNPTLDLDAGFWLFPLNEGPLGTGLAQATFDFATGASGVSAALISAIEGEPQATLLNGSDVATFPKLLDAGQPLYGIPLQAARLYLALIDSANNRHDFTLPLTVTVSHELRHASVIGT